MTYSMAIKRLRRLIDRVAIERRYEVLVIGIDVGGADDGFGVSIMKSERKGEQ